MMPADSQRRDLTPLSEESKSEESPSSTSSYSSRNDVMCSLSILILCGRSSLQQEQQSLKNRKIVCDAIGKGQCGLCIEVNGCVPPDTPPTSSCNDDYRDTELILLSSGHNVNHHSGAVETLLIEKWILSLIPYNSDDSLNTTSVQFLSQAMKSFLYFSQINSWSVSNGGKCPFNLLHRVYPIDSSAPSTVVHYQSLEYHRFPLVRLGPSSPDCIEVCVTYLPRLDTIPSQLINSLPYDNEEEVSVDIERLSINGTSPDPTNIELSIDTSMQTCKKEAKSTKNGFDDLHNGCLNGSSNGSRGAVSSRLIFPLTHQLLPSSPTNTVSHCDSNEESGRGGTNNGSGATEHIKSSRLIISNLHRPSSTSSSTSNSNNGCTSVNPPTLTHPIQITKNTSKGVQPPGASSPIPFLFRHTSLTNMDSKEKVNRKKLKRRSCGVYSSKNSSCPTPPTRSMSLPAVVPNLCLLGTFEESVLNGRIDPLGYVDGFTAELGASGSFCPPHISLPVTASFFSLSDDRGSSPYLGQVDLSILRKRGYRIPQKGTVQLTLFNPSKTVVKVFIIIYDHSDMPSNTTTFIRQKTLSRSLHRRESGCSTGFILPCLQYLIHLRFLCSKSGHVYLHTDIKMLFARRAPDTDPDISKVSLYTTHEGPTNPKYGPLSKELC